MSKVTLGEVSNRAFDISHLLGRMIEGSTDFRSWQILLQKSVEGFREP
jgi:hypothetical protein